MEQKHAYYTIYTMFFAFQCVKVKLSSILNFLLFSLFSLLSRILNPPTINFRLPTSVFCILYSVFCLLSPFSHIPLQTSQIQHYLMISTLLLIKPVKASPFNRFCESKAKSTNCLIILSLLS